MALLSRNFCFVCFLWAVSMAIHQTLWEDKLPFEFHFMSNSHLFHGLSVKSREWDKSNRCYYNTPIDMRCHIYQTLQPPPKLCWVLPGHSPASGSLEQSLQFHQSAHHLPSPCSPQPCRERLLGYREQQQNSGCQLDFRTCTFFIIETATKN